MPVPGLCVREGKVERKGSSGEVSDTGWEEVIKKRIRNQCLLNTTLLNRYSCAGRAAYPCFWGCHHTQPEWFFSCRTQWPFLPSDD